MKRILLATAVLALGACASSGGETAAKTPADMIVGKWTCSAAPEGIQSDAVVDYIKGGAAKVDAKLAVEQGGMAIEILATGDATWTFLPDGKLEETITKLTVVSGKTGGRDVPPALIQEVRLSNSVSRPYGSGSSSSGSTSSMSMFANAEGKGVHGVVDGHRVVVGRDRGVSGVCGPTDVGAVAITGARRGGACPARAGDRTCDRDHRRA